MGTEGGGDRPRRRRPAVLRRRRARGRHGRAGPRDRPGQGHRPGFRGCAFNNASIEYADPDHPARSAARDYRTALHDRLHRLAERLVPANPAAAAALAGQLAVLIDGAYTNAVHLGPGGPAATGLALAHELVDRAAR
ncbi:hypothetical protein GCM10009557_31730 [Virgisporangium ochraceum]|uniref:TetR family transcriptional regulator n=1 Tax=Virgisporangium ochraceum TaxID=65505 RepID=A0A8J3ZWY0_9ACTN|nr:hypothetical protein [Virgisporangium ochraceum]GIJ71579.1 hypothetical protein Voc01_064960 [Virgisporangium ochraceum]